MSNNKFSIAVHGGAGTILKTDMTPELEQAYTTALQQAVDAGYKILQQNGTAINAVAAASEVLENCILFNAGKGSVFTNSGTHEMDAAIMNGLDLTAGAVAGIKNVPNPILVAKAVMQKSQHVLLSGQGAQDFALQHGFTLLGNNYFFSQFRYDQFRAMRDTDSIALDHNQSQIEQLMRDKKFGTIGAVACDTFGNVAAATSTGGMTNKKYGRIGDTPIIGSGTYANNNTCAISCTGHGELFLRAVAAYDVSCLMEYKGLNLQQAMYEVVHKKLVAINGEGGMIGVTNKGEVALQFNSEGMYRGYKIAGQQTAIAIYKN
jgi:L-asparaginase / beta-aspartyl-peptidase